MACAAWKPKLIRVVNWRDGRLRNRIRRSMSEHQPAPIPLTSAGRNRALLRHDYCFFPRLPAGLMVS